MTWVQNRHRPTASRYLNSCDVLEVMDDLGKVVTRFGG
jgi:hypothetical protein